MMNFIKIKRSVIIVLKYRVNMLLNVAVDVSKFDTAVQHVNKQNGQNIKNGVKTIDLNNKIHIKDNNSFVLIN